MAEQNPVTLPRSVVASKARLTDPGYSKEQGTDIRDTETNFLNQSIRTLRQVDPVEAIRALSRFNGVFSTAVHSYVQLAMSGYSLTGYAAGTHDFDLSTTLGARSMAVASDTLYDYTVGYGDKQGLDSTIETLLKEVVQTGACSAELVLNRFRLPERIVAVPVPTLNWKSRSDGSKFPEQVPTGTGGDPISLDIPTFFYAASHQQSNSIFPRSPMEAALQTVFVYAEFIEDIYKILRKSGHSRTVVSIALEHATKTAPADVQGDSKKLKAYLEGIRTDIESVVSGLEPDEALVTYDTAKVDILRTAGEKSDYSALLDSFSGMFATSLKSMPSTLGMRIQGSQSLSNTESLIYLKMVSSIQKPVEVILSRVFTLATRLITGTDGYVKFKFKPIDIRPESELSAHRSVDMQNIMRQLSVGFLTDDEAAHIVGSGPRAPGAPNLSGTMFLDPSGSEDPGAANEDGATERTLTEGTANGSATSSAGGTDNNEN